MSKKIAFTNTSARVRFVAGQMVAPSETIYVEPRDHPEYTPAPVQRPRKTRTDPVLALLDNAVKDIIPQLPELSDEEFDRLTQGEKDGKTRSSLLKAFDEEYLRRAEAKVDADKDKAPSE